MPVSAKGPRNEALIRDAGNSCDPIVRKVRFRPGYSCVGGSYRRIGYTALVSEAAIKPIGVTSETESERFPNSGSRQVERPPDLASDVNIDAGLLNCIAERAE